MQYLKTEKKNNPMQKKTDKFNHGHDSARQIPQSSALPVPNMLVPLSINYPYGFKNNGLKTQFEKNTKKLVQSAVVDTIGVDDIVTIDEATLEKYKALISEESKERKLLSPPSSA